MATKIILSLEQNGNMFFLGLAELLMLHCLEFTHTGNKKEKDRMVFMPLKGNKEFQLEDILSAKQLDTLKSWGITVTVE